MRARGIDLRYLLALGLALLLAATGAAAGTSDEPPPPAPPASGDGDVAPAAPADAEAEASDTAGGCPGCRNRAAAADPGPRCGRGGREGCCFAMGRHEGGMGYGRPGGMGHGRRGGGMGRGEQGAGMGHGRRGGGMGPGPHGSGMGRGGGPAVMQTVRALMHEHRGAIERRTEEIVNGVVTVTRSPSSPAAADAIRRHVREMKELLASGGRVRGWDPLFREIFEHAGKITLDIEELEDGMRVTETSDDPQVVKLIQAHARKVTEFVERGPAAAHEETPLPEGYGAAD